MIHTLILNATSNFKCGHIEQFWKLTDKTNSKINLPTQPTQMLVWGYRNGPFLCRACNHYYILQPLSVTGLLKWNQN